MSFSRYACSFLILTIATPASAELKAEDVWGDWQAYVSGLGYSIAGNQRRDGNTVIVDDVEIRGGSASEGVTSIMRIDSLILTENADGSVDLAFPGSMPLEVTATDVNGITTRTSMDTRQSGLTMTASGSPTELVYVYAAQSLSMVTTALEVNGDVMGPDSGLEFTLENLSGRSEMNMDSLRNYTQSISAERVTYAFRTIDPATDSKGELTGSSQALQFEGKGAVPLEVVQATDMNAMLAAGFTLEGTFIYQGNTTNVSTQTPQGPFDIAFASDNGALEVSMGESGLSYSATQNDLEADVMTSGVPFPLQFTIANAGVNLTMPLQKSDTPEDFALGFNLGGFTMSDVMWGIFDPSGQLPRDPATVLLDLTGKARLLFDFLDPSATLSTADPNASPAEIESLDINSFEVSLAGVELTGNGAFTFLNKPDEPAPTPVGGVNMKLVGGNGLLDKLVGLNLLPEQDAMGARMMMGLLTVPGTDPDTVTSKIEVNEEWHIFANGQRIQ